MERSTTSRLFTWRREIYLGGINRNLSMDAGSNEKATFQLCGEISYLAVE